MSLPVLPRPSFSAANVIRLAHPAQLPVIVLLGGLAVISFGFHAGLVTAMWLAVVSPSLFLIDLREKRLPNVLVVPGFAAFAVDVCWAWLATATPPLPAVATVTVVLVALLAMNLAGGLGMGDVKLAGVISGCLSVVAPWLTVVMLLAAFFLGGAFSAVLLLRHRNDRGRRIAFGPFLLLAFWLVTILLAARSTDLGSVS